MLSSAEFEGVLKILRLGKCSVPRWVRKLAKQHNQIAECDRSSGPTSSSPEISTFAHSGGYLDSLVPIGCWRLVWSMSLFAQMEYAPQFQHLLGIMSLVMVVLMMSAIAYCVLVTSIVWFTCVPLDLLPGGSHRSCVILIGSLLSGFTCDSLLTSFISPLPSWGFILLQGNVECPNWCSYVLKVKANWITAAQGAQMVNTDGQVFLAKWHSLLMLISRSQMVCTE